MLKLVARPRHRSVVECALGLFCLCSSLSARGAENEPIENWTLESANCSQRLVDDVRELLRIELANMPASALSGDLRIELRCASGSAHVRVISEKAEESRHVDLHRANTKVHARVIALATAELVRDEPAPPPEPEPKPVETLKPLPTAPVEVDQGAPRRIRKYAGTILIFGMGSNFAGEAKPLLGGGLRFDYRLSSIALGIDSSIGVRQQAFELGDTSTSAMALAAYIAWAGSYGKLSSRLGLGQSFGVVRITSEPTDPTRVTAANLTGAWAAPYLLAALRIAPSLPLLFELRAQAGYVTLPVHGSIARGEDIHIAGLWTSLQLGAGLEL